MDGELKDLFINGNAVTSGGDFRYVEINGRGKIIEHISCQKKFACNGRGYILGNVLSDDISINGSCTINGNCVTKFIKVNGFIKIGGNLISDEIIVDGKTKIEGNSQVNTMTINGTCTSGGDLITTQAKINGHCKIIGKMNSNNIILEGYLNTLSDCSVGKLIGAGRINIDGLLTCEKIDISLAWSSRIIEIKADTVSINLTPKVPKIVQKFTKIKLESNKIKGNEISITSTTAEIVRGKNVKIGPDCKIDLVQYTDTLQVDPTAIIKEAVKVTDSINLIN